MHGVEAIGLVKHQMRNVVGFVEGEALHGRSPNLCNIASNKWAGHKAPLIDRPHLPSRFC
jgi:hypothetical protein